VGSSVALLVLMAVSVWAAPRQADFIFHDGAVRKGQFVRLKNDTVYVSIGTGETVNTRAFYKLDFRKISLEGTDSLVDLNLTDFEFPDPPKDTVKIVKKVVKGNATLKVNSAPPGARIYFDDKLLNGVTPLEIKSLPPGRHKVSTRKYLKDSDWWGSEYVELENGKTHSVNIKLERPMTNLRVQTMPTGAEVYLDDVPSRDNRDFLVSDTTLMDIRPGEKRKLRLFKVGYYDTVLTVNVLPFETTRIGVDLRAVEDPEYLNKQNAFVSSRTQRKWGKVALWCSLAPLAVSGYLWYLAEKDYEDANSRKRVYESAGILSAETDQMIEENKSFNESGDSKVLSAAITAGSALGLAAVGLVLYF
jgi:hypothetical protein